MREVLVIARDHRDEIKVGDVAERSENDTGWGDIALNGSGKVTCQGCGEIRIKK